MEASGHFVKYSRYALIADVSLLISREYASAQLRSWQAEEMAKYIATLDKDMLLRVVNRCVFGNLYNRPFAHNPTYSQNDAVTFFKYLTRYNNVHQSYILDSCMNIVKQYDATRDRTIVRSDFTDMHKILVFKTSSFFANAGEFYKMGNLCDYNHDPCCKYRNPDDTVQKLLDTLNVPN
jgi:hypothetical protein